MTVPPAAVWSVSSLRPDSESAGVLKQPLSQKSDRELPFADLVRGLLQDTSQQQSAVHESVEKMLSGEIDSIHDVVLTASRADLAFRLVMEIRNRLISSYQEIMRMQV